MGVFITIAIDNSLLSTAQQAALVPLCPVDIFIMQGDQLIAHPEREDECTLCALCLRAAPSDAIRILKRYSGEVLTSNGEGG